MHYARFREDVSRESGPPADDFRPGGEARSCESNGGASERERESERASEREREKERAKELVIKRIEERVDDGEW